MVKCVLVCITKNEKRYMSEYIKYYLKLGFSSIFLYDNSDRFDLQSFHKPPKVNIVHFPGPIKQIPAYNHFLQNHKHKYDYVAFFDSDEFLVLKKHTNIGDFCQEMIPSGAIGINWYMFGNNGHEEYSDDLVINRFTRRAPEMDQHVKTIAKCSDIKEMVVHNPGELNYGHFVNCKGEVLEPLNSPFNTNFDDSIAQLNHYYTKSTQECREKVNRGRSDIRQKRKFEDLISSLALNQVEDLWAFRFFNNISFPTKIAKVVLIKTKSELNLIDKQAELFSTIFIYSYFPILDPVSDSRFWFKEIKREDDHKKDFLKNHKNNFTHVIFLEPSDRLETSDILSFCENEVSSGAVWIPSKDKSNRRLLGNCRDILEVQPLKLGFKEKIKETNKLQYYQELNVEKENRKLYLLGWVLLILFLLGVGLLYSGIFKTKPVQKMKRSSSNKNGKSYKI